MGLSFVLFRKDIADGGRRKRERSVFPVQQQATTIPIPLQSSTVPLPNNAPVAAVASRQRIRQRATAAGSSSSTAAVEKALSIVAPTTAASNDDSNGEKKKIPPRHLGRHRRTRAMGGTDFRNMVLTELKNKPPKQQQQDLVQYSIHLITV